MAERYRNEMKNKDLHIKKMEDNFHGLEMKLKEKEFKNNILQDKILLPPIIIQEQSLINQFDVHQNSSCYSSDNTQSMKLESIRQPATAKMSGGLTNGGSSLQPGMQSGVGMPGLSRWDDVSPNLLMNQNTNMGIMHGMNGEGIVKAESGYLEEPPFMFNPANGVLERHPVMLEIPIPSFIGEESNPKPVSEPITDPDVQSFGFLGQIPRNFSLSDLTVDFSISSDILDNYSRSPYLATDTEFLNPHGNGNIQVDTRSM